MQWQCNVNLPWDLVKPYVYWEKDIERQRADVYRVKVSNKSNKSVSSVIKYGRETGGAM